MYGSGSKELVLATHANVPPELALVVCRKLATLAELNSIYSYEDALDLLEIIRVDEYNQMLITEERKRNQAQGRV